MKVLETDSWAVGLPGEWQADQEEELVVIVDQDEVSTIEITTLVKESGEVTSEELESFSADLVSQGFKPLQKNMGDFSGHYFELEEDGGWFREWYLACKNIFLLVAHGCAIENKGMDDSVVDEILQGLQLVEREEQP